MPTTQNHTIIRVFIKSLIGGHAVRLGECAVCGTVKPSPNDGGWRCPATRTKGTAGEYRTHKKTCCDKCGKAKAAHNLLVHHVTGSHDYGTADHLVTLCFDCHGDIENICDRYLMGEDVDTDFVNLIKDGWLSGDYLETSKKAKSRLLY